FARSSATACLRSGSCTSARAFAPRFFQTLRRRNALALRYDFTSIRLSRGLSPPSCRTCSAHKQKRPLGAPALGNIQKLQKGGPGSSVAPLPAPGSFFNEK